MASVTQSWRKIEEVFWENAHIIYCALRKPASPKQIANLSKVVAYRQPKDFVKSLQIHDGLKDSYLGPIRLFDYYSLLPFTAILSEYRMQCNLQAECDFGGNAVHDEPCTRNESH